MRRFCISPARIIREGIYLDDGKIFLVSGKSDRLSVENLQILGITQLRKCDGGGSNGRVYGVPMDAIRKAILKHSKVWSTGLNM